MRFKWTILLVWFLMLTMLSKAQTVTFSGKKVKLTKVFDAIESQTGYTLWQ